ncbi:MAG: hypothetical protein MHMPM18_004606 [Marteilia pararefringens]
MQTANFESKDCGDQQKKQLIDYEQLPKFQKLSTQNEGIDNCLGGTLDSIDYYFSIFWLQN